MDWMSEIESLYCRLLPLLNFVHCERITNSNKQIELDSPIIISEICDLTQQLLSPLLQRYSN